MDKDNIKKIKNDINNYVCKNFDDIEIFRLKYISKKSIINKLMQSLKDYSLEERKNIGQALNEIKSLAKKKLIFFSTTFKKVSNNEFQEDLTLPPNINIGSLHPLTKTKQKLISIFRNIGFNLSSGPEIEDEWHNFTALNVPDNHPARDVQDTFFIKNSKSKTSHVLRTQTSSVQIRVMENQKPPIRTVSIGRVYRKETISARSHCVFNQIEALYINKGVSFKNLKETINYFVKELFGKNIQMRLRPSYFPFTEPSAEVDISCLICSSKGCKICKYTGWVEIGGAGMVDPNVLKNCKIDSDIYTGFAFGMGIERITMLIYRINDLRLFTENNVKFLEQFAILE